MRPLLIGQAPAKYSEGHRALCGITGRHLAMLAGMHTAAFMEAVDTVNVLDRFPGSAEHGDLFPMREARERAEDMLPLLQGRRVLFVGMNVAVAFRQRCAGVLAWHETTQRLGEYVASYTFAVIPHPSLVNRWWNDHDNRVRAARFLRDLLGVSTSVAEQPVMEL